MRSLKIISHSERETIDLGRRLMHHLKPGDIVCLFGMLGAGKTIIVKGMAGALGINRDQVRSPSFVLINEYHSSWKQRSNISLYHLDLFRLKDYQNILDLGYEEYLYSPGICVIEWAQRLQGLLPPQFLKVVLEIKDENTRVIKLIAKGARYRSILQNRLR